MLQTTAAYFYVMSRGYNHSLPQISVVARVPLLTCRIRSTVLKKNQYAKILEKALFFLGGGGRAGFNILSKTFKYKNKPRRIIKQINIET